MNDFEKPAASRHTLGAATLGRRIDLSVGSRSRWDSAERERPFGRSSVRIMFGHYAERCIPTTSITRDCELPRIGSPRIPATRDSSRRRARSVRFFFDSLPFIRSAPFAVS